MKHQLAAALVVALHLLLLGEAAQASTEAGELALKAVMAAVRAVKAVVARLEREGD